MIYCNCAATSYPKPQPVLDAFQQAAAALPAGQFRGGSVVEAEDIFSACREKLASILGIRHADRIFFSSGATDSLNALFHGFGLSSDNVITTATEHNSVLRPLCNRAIHGGELRIVPCDEDGFVDPEDFQRELNRHSPSGCKAIVLNHCSNVTGAVQNVSAIGHIAKEHGLLFILDCSQSAGCIPIHADEWGVDALVFTGHKSLFGLQGTGGYYISPALNPQPFRFGGTGRDSSRLLYDVSDYEYEPGTQNLPGISALNTACELFLSEGIAQVFAQESKRREFLIRELSQITGLHILGRETSAERQYGPLVSVTVDGMASSDVSYILQNAYGIITRSGLMCAPLIHPFLHTGKDGVVRLSFSRFTSQAELQQAADALREIASAQA